MNATDKRDKRDGDVKKTLAHYQDFIFYYVLVWPGSFALPRAFAFL